RSACCASTLRTRNKQARRTWSKWSRKIELPRGGRVSQEAANFGGTCWISTAIRRTTACGRRRTPSSPPFPRQGDRLFPRGIRDLGASTLAKKVAHQIRLACLRRYMKSSLAFIRGRCAGDAHRVGQSTCDLSIHIGAALEEQLHQFHIHRAAGAGLCSKACSAAVSGSDSGSDQERREAHVIDVGISALVQQ